MTDAEILTMTIAVAGLMMKRHIQTYHSTMNAEDLKDWLSTQSKEIEDYMLTDNAKLFMQNITVNREMRKILKNKK